MKKKILVIATLALLVAAPVFAADGSQQGGNWMNDMFKYCNQAMQQWGNGNQPSQSGQTQPQGQPMSYSGGMMMGNGSMMGGMMGNGNYGNMMGNGGYGNMMGNVQFQ